MTRAMEHCDDTVMEHFDDIDQLGNVMKGIMEHCDDWGQEALL